MIFKFFHKDEAIKAKSRRSQSSFSLFLVPLLHNYEEDQLLSSSALFLINKRKYRFQMFELAKKGGC